MSKALASDKLPSCRALCAAARMPATQSLSSAKSAVCLAPTPQRYLPAPGDRVVYAVPSWNNNHYCHLTSAVGVPVATSRDDTFLPTRELFEPVIRGARLLSLNSPLNPTGTAFTAEALGGICDLVLVAA